MAYWATAPKPAVKMIWRMFRADGGHGGDTEDVDEHGEGDESAANAHQCGQDADDHAAGGHDPAGNALAAGHEVLVEGDHGGDVEVLQLDGHAGHAEALTAAVGIAAGVLTRGTQEVEQGVEAEESEQHRVDDADEHVRKQRVPVVEPFIDGAADERAADGPHQEGDSQFARDVAELFVHRGAHDGLGEDVEQVGADGQDAFDAGGHERRVMMKPPPAPSSR
jgi:hypothetical protein